MVAVTPLRAFLAFGSFLASAFGEGRFDGRLLRGSATTNVGLRIINNCEEDIDLRTPHIDQGNEDDSNGDYVTLAAKGGEKYFPPGNVKANKVVLAWKDASAV